MMQPVDLVRRLDSNMSYNYAVMFCQVETTNWLLNNSLKQWQIFNQRSWAWMGNVIMGEDRILVKPYSEYENLGLEIFLKSIAGVQQSRSQRLSDIDKIDIGSKKNPVRAALLKIIEEENGRTGTMQELEEAVFARIYAANDDLDFSLSAAWTVYYKEEIKKLNAAQHRTALSSGQENAASAEEI